MTTAQFFVYRRPVAWTALVATLAWGVLAYLRMPQRQDPIIPVRSGVVITPYPGARAEKVELEVTRKVEKKVAENPAVEKVQSISRQGLSIVFVDLFDAEKNAELVWQDLAGKLQTMSDLPRVGDMPLQPKLDKDFGDTVAVMLTISSPEVSDFEVELRARSIRGVLEEFRASRPEPLQANRVSGVLVYPNTVARSYVLWLGEGLLQTLTEQRLALDGHVVEAPSTGCVDFQLAPGRTDDELARAVDDWYRHTVGIGLFHPDVWPGILIRDLEGLAPRLRAHPHDPYLTLNRYSYRELERFADLIQDRLKQSPHIGKVEQIGVQDEAVYLYYSDRRLAAFGLQPQSIVDRLTQTNINLPGGRVELPDQNTVVQPSGAFRSESDIGQVVVDVKAGYPLYMRDLVEIVRGYEDPPEVMNFRTVKVDALDPPTRLLPGEHSLRLGDESNQRPLPARYRLQTTRAVTLAIRQIKGSQIAEFGRDIDLALASLRGVLPDDLQIARTSNEPALVREKIHQFNLNLLEAMVIVVVVALVFMEWRSAVLVAASIPLTVAMTLGLCQVVGIDLQQVSIAALIIALGLLVDDPVVAGDAINRELAHGTARDVAAWLGPQKLARAILFATVTNVVAFLPLLLVSGKTGEFIYSLPIVVTASLVSSRIVSMTFMPLLGFYLLKGQKGFEAGLEPGGKGSRFVRYYNGFSDWCLRHKRLSLGGCVVLLAAGVAALPRIPTAFFPKDLHSVFLVNVYLGEGSPIRQTHDEAMRVIRAIDELEQHHVRAYTTFIGAGGPRFWLSVVPEQRADNYAQILVHTANRHETRSLVQRLKQSLPPRAAAARITIEEIETGPPVGVPVQVRLTGHDAETLRTLADQTKNLLASIPGTDNIHDDWDPEVLQMSLTIDADKANLTGISNQDIAQMLETGLSGWSPTQLRQGDHLIPIVLRLRSDERTRIEDLANISAISSLTNVRVPLSQVSEFHAELVAPKVRRRNHQRCLTVKCDSVPGVLPSKIVEQLNQTLTQAATRWPPGYRFEFGGEREEQQKGFASVALALAVSLAAIYLALVLQFNSVTKPLVVFAAVPFGLVAGMMGLLLFDAPFGFMAFLGVASLAGVIVSHIIVLFDYIEEMRERGEPLRRAVIDAALVRLRPVLVTVLATVGGLIPLAIEGGPLWQPMCYVLIVGLLAATLVTKVLVPVLYVLFVENLRLIRWEPPGQHPGGPPPESARAAAH